LEFSLKIAALKKIKRLPASPMNPGATNLEGTQVSLRRGLAELLLIAGVKVKLTYVELIV
jgi:Fe2+ transport system protein FeoA